jgi:hypothetical protein
MLNGYNEVFYYSEMMIPIYYNVDSTLKMHNLNQSKINMEKFHG